MLRVCCVTARYGDRRVSALLMAATMAVALMGATPASADNAVQLKVLVVSIGDKTTDGGLAYIQPVLDEMGVPYDVLNSATTNLTAATLSPGGCSATATGCVGNYNGIILTETDLRGNFASAEWTALHDYERDFKVRESVLSGYPTYSWETCNAPTYLNCAFDYGMDVTNSGALVSGTNFTGKWNVSGLGKEVFEYVNTASVSCGGVTAGGGCLPITDFAFAATPRNDGTVAVTPLLTDQGTGKLLISRLTYPDGRQVLLSTITNAGFLIHSQVLAYEFVNFATSGVMVGGRYVHMAVHLDDLFNANELWNPDNNATDSLVNFGNWGPLTGTVIGAPTTGGPQYRLTGADITSGVSRQAAFRTAHPTAGNAFRLDFAYNGIGVVVDPAVAQASLQLKNPPDDLTTQVVANKGQLRFINHTLTHADMDAAPTSTRFFDGTPCDYDILTTVSAIQQEITKNRRVAQLLGIAQASRALVSGNHSGIKNRNCTDIPELHPGMANVQSDDVAYPAGANPLFFRAMANAGVEYIASDSSQVNQDQPKYANEVNDGASTDRIMVPRTPANLFYNVINPDQWVDEYNYIYRDRPLELNGGEYCSLGVAQPPYQGSLCAYRNYEQILAAEADSALRLMLSFKKNPFYVHQANLANYGQGQSLIFDWLNAVFTEYERLFKVPVRNYAFELIGDKTRERLVAKSATIGATWNRVGAPAGTTCAPGQGFVTLSANKSVPNLQVTGVGGGGLYGGQLIREITINATPNTVCVNRALTQ
jgi:hypothetical protein